MRKLRYRLLLISQLNFELKLTEKTALLPLAQFEQVFWDFAYAQAQHPKHLKTSTIHKINEKKTNKAGRRNWSLLKPGRGWSYGKQGKCFRLRQVLEQKRKYM